MDLETLETAEIQLYDGKMLGQLDIDVLLDVIFIIDPIIDFGIQQKEHLLMLMVNLIHLMMQQYLIILGDNHDDIQ